jgi:hypothetical protein
MKGFFDMVEEKGKLLLFGGFSKSMSDWMKPRKQTSCFSNFETKRTNKPPTLIANNSTLRAAKFLS